MSGKIWPGATLSRHGCSWIFEDAELKDSAQVTDDAVLAGTTRVENEAKISEKALVIDAVVSDDAEVSGNAFIHDAVISENAEVTDNAVVSGGARVHGHAKVSGHAEVRGGEVSGHVVVTGDADDHAVVLDGMIVDGSDCASGVVCIYDGKRELDRAARTVLSRTYTEVLTRFKGFKYCDLTDYDAEQEANMLVYPRPGLAGRDNQTAAGARLRGCGNVETHRELAQIMAKDAAGLVFGFALGLRGSFQLPRFIATPARRCRCCHRWRRHTRDHGTFCRSYRQSAARSATVNRGKNMSLPGTFLSVNLPEYCAGGLPGVFAVG